MRKTIIALLIAASATPALASQADQERDSVAQEPQHESPAVSERQEAPVYIAAAQAETEQAGPSQAPEVDQVQISSHADAPRVDTDAHGGLHREYRQEHQELHRSNPSRREHRDFHQEVNRDHRQVHRDVHSDRHQDYRTEHRDLHRSNPTRVEHREFHRDVNRDHQNFHRDWDPNWRGNQSYDWRSYRSRYGSLYQAPDYYDPFGSAYGYRRYSIGFSLGQQYYSSRYVINDPWRYRLPPTTINYRWIRYYDDVLLVDVYSGRVVDVIYDFFW